MSVLIAIGAGLLSFFSPCVLPMVPIYIGYLSGAAVTPEGIVAVRREAVAHAAAFVLGFTLIFVAIWSALSVLTVIFTKTDLARAAGVILIIFGIHFIGIVRIPFLYQEARVVGCDRAGDARIVGVARHGLAHRVRGGIGYSVSLDCVRVGERDQVAQEIQSALAEGGNRERRFAFADGRVVVDR